MENESRSQEEIIRNNSQQFGDKFLNSPELEQWITNQAKVSQNVIAVVTRKFGESVPDHETRSEAARTTLELHALKIEGLRTGAAFVFGPNKQPRLERLPVDPVVTFGEKYGGAIESFYSDWLVEIHARYLQFSNALNDMTMAPAAEETQKLRQYIHDMTLDVMFIEPDPTHTCVVKAWHSRRMHPKLLVGPEGRRDVTVSRQYADVAVHFHAETEISEAVDKEAHEILTKINDAMVNPYDVHAAVTSIHGDVLNPKKDA